MISEGGKGGSNYCRAMADEAVIAVLAGSAYPAGA